MSNLNSEAQWEQFKNLVAKIMRAQLEHTAQDAQAAQTVKPQPARRTAKGGAIHKVKDLSPEQFAQEI